MSDGSDINKSNINISVIITALNEEEGISSAIADALKACSDFNIKGEIIVVNDGSTDKTEEIVKEFMQKSDCVRMIKHDTPHGIGASFWDGVDRSRGDVVVWFPGDNENDPWEIFRYFKLLGHVDIVIPFIFNREARSLWRNALSYAYRFIINTTFVVNFNYTNGTILYRKSILKDLSNRSSGFFFQTDILIRTTKKGYLFAEVPYRIGLRSHGASKAVSFPSLWKVIKGYVHLVKDHYFRKHQKDKKYFQEGSQTAIRRQAKD